MQFNIIQDTFTYVRYITSVVVLTDFDLCPCAEIQTMSYIIKSCPFTKLNGGLSQLHSADDAAIAWLTNYGS